MASGKKIADSAGRMTSSPLISWIRKKLIRGERLNAEGKLIRDDFVNAQRYPQDQSARDQPDPKIPGGIHHKIEKNYYLDRDGRRNVNPPVVIAAAGKELLPAAEAALVKPIKLGPTANFGLPATVPTPGFGHSWARNAVDELKTQQSDGRLKLLERYDNYVHPSAASS